MNCPGCATEMTHLAFEGRLGATIEIDLCSVCRAIWFDHFEELRLTPGATLKVFGMISEPAGRPTTLFPTALHCPRCNGRLLLTHDMQRSTPFQYWRCDSGHGRLITFVDFLREKDFVRPLTPQQLEELRQNIQTINCSNCGAAINLVKDSVCKHCGSRTRKSNVPNARTRTMPRSLSCTMTGFAVPHWFPGNRRSEEHTSELQSRQYLVC